MRRIIFLSAAIALLGITSSSFAQTMGGSTGGSSGSTGGSTGGSSGGSSGGSGSGASNNSGNFSNFSNSFNTGSSTDAASFGGLGSGTTTGRTGGGTSNITISPTNFLSLSYGNPLFMGRPSASTFGGTPTAIQAGFGQQSFGAITTTNTNNLNRMGLGNRGGLGGTASISGSSSQQQNTARVHHTAELKFPVRQVNVPQLQTDLQGIVNRSSAIKNPSAVTVQMDGRVAVLRGQVTNDDERRLVEGMIRLTPGVQGVVNELRTQSP